MPRVTSPDIEHEVLINYQPGMSYRYLSKILKKKKILVTDKTCKEIIERRGKRREAAAKGEKYQKYQPPQKVTQKVLKLIERRASIENPKTQKIIGIETKVSQSTVNRVIHNRLEMETKMKTKTHVLNERDKQNRMTNCWKLYKNQLAGDKCQVVVTLDESWIRLNVSGGTTTFCYVRRGESVPGEWIKPTRSLWEEKFMVIGAMTYDRTFPLIRVPKGTNVDSEFYVNHVLKPLIHKHLIPHFKDNISKVFIHHDKSTVHTSEITTNYMKKMNEKYGIKFIQKPDIPTKGADCAPLDFFGFGCIKQSVERMKFTSVNQLWNKCKQVWNKVPADMCMDTFESWKLRCRKIREESGSQIEQRKDIHQRRLPLKSQNQSAEERMN